VGRGGLKLERALDEFHIDCTGVVALDIGASTGGFTDCMLQRGAAHVFAVDAGVGQLSPSLRTDARVTNIENCNARYLNRAALGPAFPTDGVAFAVMDVSFISQTLIYPALVSLLSREANVVTLIKPQFEAGRGKVGKGGIVRSAQAQRDAVLKVLESAAALSLSPVALIPSPIRGGDGNTEYLLQLKYADHPVGAAFEDLLRGVGLS
jgi:23S rRNA (cytidine1920-2'-O)/16S rRNA (cytidine1409-2'-O)-methyltransferase